MTAFIAAMPEFIIVQCSLLLMMRFKRSLSDRSKAKSIVYYSRCRETMIEWWRVIDSYSCSAALPRHPPCSPATTVQLTWIAAYKTHSWVPPNNWTAFDRVAMHKILSALQINCVRRAGWPPIPVHCLTQSIRDLDELADWFCFDCNKTCHAFGSR